MRTMIVSIALLAVTPTTGLAGGGAWLVLEPDNPGPYFGGESLTVDLWFDSLAEADVLLKMIRFDFSQTDPAITTDDEFVFDYSSIPGDSHGYFILESPEMPVPSTTQANDCQCTGMFIPLTTGESLHIGSVGIQLPTEPGVYEMEALNAAESDPFLGALLIVLNFDPPYPLEFWSAYEGEIVGESLSFVVVPEPATLLLLAAFAGCLLVSTRNRRRQLRSVRDAATLLCQPPSSGTMLAG